jgi:uncharacterized membrane protein YeaQ/YmgE (transglycosylase-associated protein family)
VDDVARADCSGGMEAGVARLACDRFTCGLVGGKAGARSRIWVLGDIVLGLIGSVIGGWIFTKLGIVHSNTFLFSLAAATVGAVILVSIAHLFFGGKES